MEIKTFFAQNADGNVVPRALVYLYYPGTTDLVSGLEDVDGNPLGNPFKADVDGQIKVAAPNGKYDIRVSSAELDHRVRVQFFDPENIKATDTEDSRPIGDFARTIAFKPEAKIATYDRALTEGENTVDLASFSGALVNPNHLGFSLFAKRHGKIVELERKTEWDYDENTKKIKVFVHAGDTLKAVQEIVGNRDVGKIGVEITGAPAIRKISDKFSESASTTDFNAYGNNENDEYTELKAFFECEASNKLMLPKVFLTSQALYVRSNNQIVSKGATIRNVASDTAEHFDSSCLIFGRCSRSDFARVKGETQSAHYIGKLSRGDSKITISGRWNNTLKDWSNPITYIPEAGDLVTVLTTDNTQPAEGTRPLPSAVCHRRIISVTNAGVVIKLDSGVSKNGDYMLVPMSRDLGYDVTSYGESCRMHAVENIEMRGIKTVSDNGHAFITQAILDSDIQIIADGLSLIYGNGIVRTRIVSTGVFSRGAVETAVGTEDANLEFYGTYEDRGIHLKTACVSLGENPIRPRIKKGRIFGKWDGDIALNASGEELTITDLEIEAAPSRVLAYLGNSHITTTRPVVNRLKITGSSSIDGKLFSTTALENADLKNLEFNCSQTVGVNTGVEFRGSGVVDGLRMSAPNTIRADATWLLKDIQDPMHLESETHAQMMTKKDSTLRRIVPFTRYSDSRVTPKDNVRIDVVTDTIIENPAVEDVRVGRCIMILLRNVNGGGWSVNLGSDYKGISHPGVGNNHEFWTGEFMWDGTFWVFIGGNGTWT
ncbi:hypothetical protein L861_02235 [Litchfieldella anticariensis FP35 = DSM 16096]|uniref:Uncharacterized protein n=1 Tax=Litchfieldella anticariensis (strain DSM 16096 / CECT 5854 / CIP 108499 / LMG 22089 / FP35) TaxID=1121939 RepID=S2KPY1_LITA3|nr:hypothetical protein [Halomonas anticariensis]EPC04152.1 hypothetical protein L861_02235 [Halomonas anticariensis FP35 = DSM 16096]